MICTFINLLYSAKVEKTHIQLSCSVCVPIIGGIDTRGENKSKVRQVSLSSDWGSNMPSGYSCSAVSLLTLLLTQLCQRKTFSVQKCVLS